MADEWSERTWSLRAGHVLLASIAGSVWQISGRFSALEAWAIGRLVGPIRSDALQLAIVAIFALAPHAGACTGMFAAARWRELQRPTASMKATSAVCERGERRSGSELSADPR